MPASRAALIAVANLFRRSCAPASNPLTGSAKDGVISPNSRGSELIVIVPPPAIGSLVLGSTSGSSMLRVSPTFTVVPVRSPGVAVGPSRKSRVRVCNSCRLVWVVFRLAG